MKAFVLSVLALVAISVAAGFALESLALSSARVYSTPAVRLN